MWRYLKSAFLARPPVPVLGRVPLNILGLIAFAGLGFREPVFWLIGAGLEILYLFALATDARFQRVVDAGRLQVSGRETDRKREDLVLALPYELQVRMAQLATRCDQAAHLLGEQAGELTLDSSYDALKRLEWLYLKLLVARNNLSSSPVVETEAGLTSEIQALEADLQSGTDSEALRRSKLATMAILKERMANIRRRAESLSEIDSDIRRIEEQVELMIENATIQSCPPAVAGIELATDLASPALFGDLESAVADLDKAYPPRSAPRALERN